MIYCECNADEILITALGFTRKMFFHAGSKGEVCNRLSKTGQSKGLVDEDPKYTQPTYIQGLQKKDPEHSIKVLRDPRRENAVIMLCPELEEWTLRAAREAKVDPLKFQLPKDPNEFYKIANANLKNFERFIREIERRSSPMFNALKKFLS